MRHAPAIIKAKHTIHCWKCWSCAPLQLAIIVTEGGDETRTQQLGDHLQRELCNGECKQCLVRGGMDVGGLLQVRRYKGECLCAHEGWESIMESIDCDS